SLVFLSGLLGSESELKFRCAIEFGRVTGWSCEVKIRKLLWSDHCFEFFVFFS
ncbi:hypothetical protein LINPERHAP1_LOCUS39869, partial [Linum perenne]